jgi:3',5'-cyclic AMP phosphodiesterase CpdA
VPGNHELQSDPAAIAVFEEQGHAPYGSFDVGRWHFVGLNTDELCNEGRVTGEQLDWLRADLVAHAGTETFVFMHRPLESWFQGDFNPDDADVLHELFRQHGVRAVFAGHDHFFDERERDGVRYFTVGGGGGTLYAQPPRGGFSHYLLVRSDNGELEVDVIEPGHIEVQTVAGNDGLEPVARVRVMNTTERRLSARNLELREKFQPAFERSSTWATAASQSRSSSRSRTEPRSTSLWRLATARRSPAAIARRPRAI